MKTMREIKFRFFTPDKRMVFEHDGWTEGIGINEALEYSSVYGYKIMQFTGLKDKNGKDIYEGDIDRSGDVIMWSNEKALFCLHHYYEVRGTWSPSTYPMVSSNIEVIGNIYQNPELL